MRLNEFYNPDADSINKYDLDDTRKPKLSLENLNKLKRIKLFKKSEMESRKEFVQKIYKKQDPNAGGMGGGLI